MMVLFDTCVVLDTILAREPFNIESNALFKMVAANRFEGLITVKSFMDIHYFLKKVTNNEKQTRRILKILSETFEIINSTTYDCVKSLTSPINDFEDAMMSQTGETIKVDYFVTRNTKDYKYSKLNVVTPKQMIKKINEA